MQFKIISGTTIQARRRVRHGQRARPRTDHDVLRTYQTSEFGKKAAHLALSTNSRGWRSSKARRMMRPIKADDVAGLKVEGLDASEVARRLKIGRASIWGDRLTPDGAPVLVRHSRSDGRRKLDVSGWRIHYLDARGRQAESTHPSKEAAISQAVDLVLRQRCRIQRIEGPNGEVIDRETLSAST
jgi:hypothetical protein